jgi:hypothetical protein
MASFDPLDLLVTNSQRRRFFKFCFAWCGYIFLLLGLATCFGLGSIELSGKFWEPSLVKRVGAGLLMSIVGATLAIVSRKIPNRLPDDEKNDDIDRTWRLR